MNQHHHLQLKGQWKLQHKRAGVVLDEFDFTNGITDAGKNVLLDAMFNEGAQATIWGVGLINNASYTGVAPTDTMVSHAGWTEVAFYTGTLRPIWGQGSAVSKALTNASPIVFTFNGGGGGVVGIFLVSDTTRGATSGILWSTALFPAVLAVQAGDILNVTYTLSC